MSPASRDGRRVLGPRDPPPFELANPEGRGPCLIVCDHASHIIPESLSDLGVAPGHRREHIAWDIGASVMARRLAERFDAPAVLAGYSRLVVDCNRYLDDPAAFAHVSDAVAVPGNATMTDTERARRVSSIYRPYHNAIHDRLEDFEDRGIAPVVIACHTMTRRPRGKDPRPQEFVVCWDRDDRLAGPVLDRLGARDDIVVGDNDPYALNLGEDYTIPEHAMRRGLPHLQFEVRQDLVAAPGDAVRWADFVHDLTADLVADAELRTVKLYWP